MAAPPSALPTNRLHHYFPGTPVPPRTFLYLIAQIAKQFQHSFAGFGTHCLEESADCGRVASGLLVVHFVHVFKVGLAEKVHFVAHEGKQDAFGSNALDFLCPGLQAFEGLAVGDVVDE